MSTAAHQRASPFDPFADSAHFAPPHDLNRASKPKRRQSFGSSSSGSADKKSGRTAAHGDQPVRRRISRACDQCNQLRTKCDGGNPCAHCVELGLACEYARERKKRGKASRKDRAALQAAAAAAPEGKDEHSSRSANDNGSEDPLAEIEVKPLQQGTKRKRAPADLQQPQSQPWNPGTVTGQDYANGGSVHTLPSSRQDGAVAERLPNDTTPFPVGQQTAAMPLPTPSDSAAGMNGGDMSMNAGEYAAVDGYHRNLLRPGIPVVGQDVLHGGALAMPNPTIQGGAMPGYGDGAYGVSTPNSNQSLQNAPFRVGESPLSAGFLGRSAASGSPAWVQMTSPSAALYNPTQLSQSNQALRYPVLQPLTPYISSIIPFGLACDLLELYFTSTSSAFMQPQSPYILGYVFRKRSFLRPNDPRVCTPALLASMLWVAAQTSESAFLTSPPSARGKICQKLLELTISLLKPLVHASADERASYGTDAVVNGIALGGFGVALHGQAHEIEGGSPGGIGCLDDVATYIHLATVVSASEYKAASLRWWNVAWSLARELKLGRELPPNAEASHSGDVVGVGQNNGAEGLNGQRNADGVQNMTEHSDRAGAASEEEREERRRIWWLLYTVDRHLALCYNRPLFLLDIECDSLLQPEDEGIWQAGEYYAGETQRESSYYRARGPTLECSGHSIFGYFLPLMTILGEIVDLNHVRNHPRFGLRFQNGNEWNGQVREIEEQLEAYGRSLKSLESRSVGFSAVSEHNASSEGVQYGGGALSSHSAGSDPSTRRMTESMLQTKIVMVYGTHLMHTLHILLNGKWDPISLLDDNDLWISSQSFVSATGHAVSAAEAIEEILEYDPDLSFMPFFFGIYLLQGSFLLLLIADKLQGEASPSVVRACETIVRAHEACVVTLNTEYQVRLSACAAQR